MLYVRLFYLDLIDSDRISLGIEQLPNFSIIYTMFKPGNNRAIDGLNSIKATPPRFDLLLSTVFQQSDIFGILFWGVLWGTVSSILQCDVFDGTVDQCRVD